VAPLLLILFHKEQHLARPTNSGKDFRSKTSVSCNVKTIIFKREEPPYLLESQEKVARRVCFWGVMSASTSDGLTTLRTVAFTHTHTHTHAHAHTYTHTHTHTDLT
jgi:hypothetical protein